jgi:hypothetical protein
MAATKSSAIDTLKSLAGKKPVAGTSVLATQLNDPAIAGAKKDKGSTVKLGFDPAIAEQAAYAAGLKAALEKAEADFAISQSEMRDYGKAKRSLYNDTFKTSVTTVCVPYTVEVPADGNSDTPGRETKYIQVICSNKYSVQADSIRANKEALGEFYPRLFEEKSTKTLKPNAEDLIRGILQEVAGLQGEELENSMNTLFEETIKVSTTENYESEVRKAPESIQTLLSQTVTRSAPGLKFQ